MEYEYDCIDQFNVRFMFNTYQNVDRNWSIKEYVIINLVHGSKL